MRSRIQTVFISLLLFTAMAANTAIASESGDDVTNNLAVPEAGKLTISEVVAILDHQEAVFFFDANGRESYLEGHIPGAQWIQYDALTAADLPESKDAMLVFYCYNPLCGASPLAARKALSLGYRNVWLVPDGIVGWRKANLPVVSGDSAK